MELAKIKSLLEIYFEGNTTLEQEASLSMYFAGKNVAPELAIYTNLFAGLDAARDEVSQRELSIPESSGISRAWWYGIAASVVVAVGIFSSLFSGNQLTMQEQEALAALNETKKAMLMLSENFNKGTGELAVLGEFTETTNRILK